MPTDSSRPLFERRHYDAIASVIRELGCTEFQRLNLATEFGLRIGQTNPRFDRARFVQACMPDVPPPGAGGEGYVPQVLPQVPDVPQVPQVPDVCQFGAGCTAPPVALCDRSGIGGGTPRYYCERHRNRNTGECCHPLDSTAPLSAR